MSVDRFGHGGQLWKVAAQPISAFQISEFQIFCLLRPIVKQVKAVMNERIYVLNSQKKTTSHVLHLLMCVPTAGCWIIIWFLVTMQNNRHNKSVDKKIIRILEHKETGKSDVEAYQAIRNEDQYKNKVLLIIIIVTLFIVYLNSRH
ncbi:hypothetical protein [Pseudomonas veronii]